MTKGYWNAMRRENYLKRADEMRRLRDEELLSLREIGDKYGITRERVRQIIGNNTLPHNMTPIQRYLILHPDTSQLTNSELANILSTSSDYASQLRHGTRHACDFAFMTNAYYWQEWFADKLIQMGISNRLLPAHRNYHIETYNGAKITVCSVDKEQTSASLRNISARWRFSIRKHNLRRKPDFYTLIIVPLEAIFIIPYDKVPNVDQMAFCYPPLLRPTMFKWGIYKDAYQLIRNFNENI